MPKRNKNAAFISRRTFLKGVMSTSIASLIGSSLLMPKISNALEMSDRDEWKLTGSHWGAFRAKINGGKVTEIKAFELDKHPSKMLNGIKDIIYSPSRVRYPMVRLDWYLHRHNSDTKQRGDNRFVRVTWDQALDMFYEELERVQNTYGPSGLHAGTTGWRSTGQLHSCGSHMGRAIAMHGSSVKKVGGYSTGAGEVILPYVMGSTEVYSQGTSWPLILDNSKNIILWACDPVKNLQVGWNCDTHDSMEYIHKLKEKIVDKKIRVISIDPVKNKTQNFLNSEHMYVNPHTDVPFMLGIAHTLIAEDLYDKNFLDIYTLGFEEFAKYIAGETEDKIEKTPEWASAICGISAENIRIFARQIASERTQLMFGWSIQRQQHGEQPYWMAVVLAAMIGQIGLPGGGISYSHHYSASGVPSSDAVGPGGFPRNLDPGKEPRHKNKDFKGASSTIPVARIADALLGPNKEINANGNKVVFPDIKMMVFTGCNPWHHHQDRNRMKLAFQKLETVITVDYNWTATCRFSDIVLPACTQYERNDIDIYGSFRAKGLVGMSKLVDPLFQSKTDFQIFYELTTRWGRGDEYTQGKNEMQWLEQLYNGCKDANKDRWSMPDFKSFWKEGYFHFGDGKNWTRHADFREDPEINALGTPSGFIEIYSRKIARYGYKDCKGHPMWFEKSERSHGGPKSDKYPVWLQSCHSDNRLNSQMCESGSLRSNYNVNGREPIFMNEIDAKKRGIKNGDIVRVFNDRGQLLAGAVISNNYPVDIIRIETGAWYGPEDESIGSLCTYGDPNNLTLDIGSSELAQATSANTCQVEFEKFKGKAPAVNSFGGPIEVV